MILILIAFIFIPIILSGPVKRLFKKPAINPDYLFDDFVCNKYFAAEFYDAKNLIDKIPLDYTRQNIIPDFRFKQTLTNYEFWVKSKFQADMLHENFDWCNQEQFVGLKQIEDLPVYVFIGIGGKPELPVKIYLIPLKNLNSITITGDLLKKHEVIIDQLYKFPE